MIGLRELALVATVVLVLYGRSGVLKSRQVQTILPWISPVRRTRDGRRTLRGRGPAALGRRPRASAGPVREPAPLRAARATVCSGS